MYRSKVPIELGLEGISVAASRITRYFKIITSTSSNHNNRLKFQVIPRRSTQAQDSVPESTNFLQEFRVEPLLFRLVSANNQQGLTYKTSCYNNRNPHQTTQQVHTINERVMMLHASHIEYKRSA